MKHSTARFFLTASLLLLAPFYRLQASDGARTVEYSESDIVPIHAKIRFSTLIVLPANEEILDFTTGDKDFWVINGVHNLCYVHPAQPGVQSDLNLITASGHIYSFILTEISNKPTEDPDLKVFVLPKDGVNLASSGGQTHYVRASEVEAYKREAEAARSEVLEADKKAQATIQQAITSYREQYPAKLQFDYEYKSKAARPPFSVIAIYHDDKFTYIRCAAQEKPTIYEIKDGKPGLLNFDLQNGVYIITKIVDKGYLAIGKQRIGFERRAASTRG